MVSGWLPVPLKFWRLLIVQEDPVVIFVFLVAALPEASKWSLCLALRKALLPSGVPDIPNVTRRCCFGSQPCRWIWIGQFAQLLCDRKRKITNDQRIGTSVLCVSRQFGPTNNVSFALDKFTVVTVGGCRSKRSQSCYLELCSPGLQRYRKYYYQQG